MDERNRRADRGPGRVVPGIAGGRSGGDEDRELDALLGAAGPRPEIPREDLDAITKAGRTAWRAQVDGLAARRRARRRAAARVVVGLAAVLVIVLGVLWWGLGRRSAGPEPMVARVEAASGVVRVAGADGAVKVTGADGAVKVTGADGSLAGVVEGMGLGPGAEVETGGAAGEPGRLSVRLADDVTVRADAETLLRVVSADVLELRRGAVYVDTGAHAGGRGIEILTPVGSARDVGTRFAVRLLGEREPALRVRVRHGAVEVAQQGRSHRAGAGEEIVVHQDGTVERRPAPVWGDDWGWVLAAAPRFDLEGRTLAELLDWVSRETGWNVRFEGEGLAESAGEITLHGSLGALRADQAPAAVLPGAGLEGELEDGTLTVRRAQLP